MAASSKLVFLPSQSGHVEHGLADIAKCSAGDLETETYRRQVSFAQPMVLMILAENASRHAVAFCADLDKLCRRARAPAELWDDHVEGTARGGCYGGTRRRG